MHKNLILIVTLNVIFMPGCSVFKKPHDQPVKSNCDVCKQAPFYVNGKRLSDTGYKR